MQRNSLTDMSARAMHQAVRLKLGKLGKINDNPMMQELDFSGMFADARKFVERIQSFGFSSVPLPIKQNTGGKGSAGIGSASVGTLAANGGDGSGEGGDPGQEEAAEGIAIFLNGQRNHPVVIGVDDRRHRPMGLKPGENAQYDDIQQMTLMRRNGLYLLSNDNEDADGKKAERMVSLRHVEKGKQQRKRQVPQKSAFELTALSPRQRLVHARAVAQQTKDDEEKQNFKHEGDSVNTEVRVTKKKIDFRQGETSVGEYDKQSDKWNMKGKEFNATPADGVHMNTKSITLNGSTGININGPTSVNGSPVATGVDVQNLLTVIEALETRLARLEART